ncbi:rCG43919 [Rattus norvegicus]|uniref:RCG43919 n=1 Tax=Rattus norvegicus TaxID=10116 RepID=A6J6Z6_RAT|nr:rCG43919 [Rattus norvegicus]
MSFTYEQKGRLGSRTLFGVCRAPTGRLGSVSNMQGLSAIRYEMLDQFKHHGRSLWKILQIKGEEGGICKELGKLSAWVPCITQRKRQNMDRQLWLPGRLPVCHSGSIWWLTDSEKFVFLPQMMSFSKDDCSLQ